MSTDLTKFATMQVMTTQFATQNQALASKLSISVAQRDYVQRTDLASIKADIEAAAKAAAAAETTKTIQQAGLLIGPWKSLGNSSGRAYYRTIQSGQAVEFKGFVQGAPNGSYGRVGTISESAARPTQPVFMLVQSNTTGGNSAMATLGVMPDGEVRLNSYDGKAYLDGKYYFVNQGTRSENDPVIRMDEVSE